MIKPLSLLFQIFLCTLGFLLTTIEISVAQVTSDGTVNTQVNQNGNVSEITGGEREGDNLFHSFQDFSVQTGNEASFLNANDIANIFSRVTGGNISNIDGLISANGSANLFLINPAGIIFGENARLDVGGSFYGSTADSILFEDGEFSATDLENPPVLTVNAPIGLNLRDQPGDITVRGDGQGIRTTTDLIDTENALRVDSDKTLALVGGKINLEGATLKTAGGRIELGSLQGNQQVRLTPINKGFGLDYAGVQNFQDIQLSETATIDASGLVAGDVQVQGNNISVTESSQIEASTLGDSPSQDPPGTIKINAIDTIKIDGQDSSNGFSSLIASQVYSDAVGDSGGLNLTTANLSLNRGRVNADSFGQGNAGLIDINASESITLNGSSISSKVLTDAEGNAGKLNITTPNLSLTNFSQIDAGTFETGNAGSIDINATKSIALDGSDISSEASEGNAGELNITTPNLSLTNQGSISATSFGQGDAGSIDINATKSITLNDISRISNTATEGGNAGELNITTPNLSLTNGSYINASTVSADTFGQGNGAKFSINTANLSLNNGSIYTINSGKENGGLIDINATESITLDSSDISTGSTSLSDGESNAGELKGNAGELNITTPNLSLTNFSAIRAGTFGKGDAGLININATKSITLDFSFISSKASIDAEGSAGKLNITTPNLSLTNLSFIGANISGKGDGDGGSININATESITLRESVISTSSDRAETESNAGNIDITTDKLSLINGSQIQSFTQGKGNAGNTTINAQDSFFLGGKDSEGFSSGIFNTVEEAATGNGGTISITTKNLGIFDGALISAFSIGQGDAGLIDINANILSLDNGEITAQAFNDVNGGNLEIDADVIVAYPNSNSDILASAEQGEGGNITINADSVLGIEQRPPSNLTSDINASSQVRGLDGSVRVNTLDVNPVEGATQLPTNVIEPEQTTQQ
ncbi:MAG: filamentous hemagglutinin N-terminal domain-containing protein, partial [Waterburya sp.]